MVHWFAHLIGRVVFRDDPFFWCKRCGKYVNL